MRALLAVAVCFLWVLAGCSGGAFPGFDPTSWGSAGARLNGTVHGGQQPIMGAHVYLFAAASGASGAGAAAYGGRGIAASTSNASVSLLTSAGNTTLDMSGGATDGDYYVTTDATGAFSISGDYMCAAGAQVYVYALGGDPGSGVNSAAGLMAALGSCPAAGNFASATFLSVNEVLTVAAAYAFAGFATDATHVGSSGTTLALTGIANAFANAANLADLAGGVALTTTPAGNGTVPQAEIYTLANVLAACVNSTGPGSSGCSTLLSDALSGGTTGTAPSDTATAAINIAHNPAANVAALYKLAGGMPPFEPGLTAQPNDFTVGISFSGGGMNKPTNVAVDGAGSVWVVNSNGGAGSGSVTKLSSLGSILSGPGGYTGGGLSVPKGIAIDPSGNAWIGNTAYGVLFAPIGVIKLSSSGVPYRGSPYVPIPTAGPIDPNRIAIDGSGNAWITSNSWIGGQGAVMEISSADNSYSGPYSDSILDAPVGDAIDANGNVWMGAGFGISEFTSAGVDLSGSSGYGAGVGGPFYEVAIDATGNVWATGYAGVVIELSSSGAVLSGSGYTGGGINKAYGIAIDGADNVWVTNTGSVIAELSNTGAAVSPSTGYIPSSGKTEGELAVDGSGNVWMTNSLGTTVVEMVGAATPVVTPLSVGVKNGSLGTRP